MEKATRPFRYDLNQIPYDYTVEVRNRFKGLDLIDRVPDELWTEVHDIVHETGMGFRSYLNGLLVFPTFFKSDVGLRLHDLKTSNSCMNKDFMI